MSIIYTDGACSGNPGRGGWGFIIINNDKISEYCGGEQETTNNRMEMTAVIQALNTCNDNNKSIYTDSKYVINGINEWLPKWKQNNWKTASKKDVKNKDLWEKLDQLVSNHNINFYYVKGHSGDQYNDRADYLARQGITDL